MKELERLKKLYPNVSDLIIIRRYVQGKNLPFSKLEKLVKHIPKADYVGTSKETIINYLRESTVKNKPFPDPYK